MFRVVPVVFASYTGFFAYPIYHHVHWDAEQYFNAKDAKDARSMLSC